MKPSKIAPLLLGAPLLSVVVMLGVMSVTSAPAAADAKLGVGKKCSSASECESGICGAWDPGVKACLPKDKSVEVTGLCAANLHCKDANATCVNHRCTLPLKLGEPCAGNGECQSGFCDLGLGSGGTSKCVPAAGTGKTGEYCSQEAHCKTKLCTTNKCEATRPAGGACRYSESCSTGFCELTSVTPSGAVNQGINQAANIWYKCVPQANKGTVGQYCTNHNQCASNQCIQEACLAKAALGASCSGGGDKQCESGYCDAGSGSGGTNKCVPAVKQGKAGEYCSKDKHCASNACVGKKCAELLGLGAACAAGDKQCASGFCDAGAGSGNTNKCVPAPGKGKAGDYCSQAAHCTSGLCTGNKCVEKLGLGFTCPGGNAQCASGFCDSGGGSGNTNKCVPAAGTGKKGDYCSQNGHCKAGKACKSHKCE